MREILTDIECWRRVGEKIAVATVVQTWGSAPRRIGARMALTASGKIAGSVSGGCVEGAVVEAGEDVLKTGRAQLLHFGVTDEAAWGVGLACGGTIEVFVQRLDEDSYEALRQAVSEERPVAAAVVVRGPAGLVGREIVVPEQGQVAGTLGADLDRQALRAARQGLAEGSSRRLTIGREPGEGREAAEPVELFIDVLLPPPKLVIVGAVHIAVSLVSLARTVGFRTIVVDPRRSFGNRERFPHADQLIQAWPDEALEQIGLTRSTAVAALTHDPKLDDPALRVALQSPAFYVGALGSRKTQEKRRQRLLADGLTEEQLARLHGPIGLDIGAQRPEEIALSIMAQIVAARNDRSAM